MNNQRNSIQDRIKIQGRLEFQRVHGECHLIFMELYFTFPRKRSFFEIFLKRFILSPSKAFINLELHISNGLSSHFSVGEILWKNLLLKYCWIKKISKQKWWQWHDNESLLMILQSIQTCPKNCEFNWTRMILLACCWCVIYMCSKRTITNEHYITKRYVLVCYSIAMLYTVHCVLLPRTYYACRIVKAGVDRIIWAACRTFNTTPNIS